MTSEKFDDLDILQKITDPAINFPAPSSRAQKEHLAGHLQTIHLKIREIRDETRQQDGVKKKQTPEKALAALDSSLLRIAGRFLSDYDDLRFSFAAAKIAACAAAKIAACAVGTSAQDKECQKILCQFLDKIRRQITTSSEYDENAHIRTRIKRASENNALLSVVATDLMHIAITLDPKRDVSREVRNLARESADYLFTRDAFHALWILASFAKTGKSSTLLLGRQTFLEEFIDASTSMVDQQIEKALVVEDVVDQSLSMVALGATIAGHYSHVPSLITRAESALNRYYSIAYAEADEFTEKHLRHLGKQWKKQALRTPEMAVGFYKAVNIVEYLSLQAVKPVYAGAVEKHPLYPRMH